MASDPVADALSSAKGALAHANASFPSKTPTAAPAKPAAAPSKAPGIGQELSAKKTMVDKARSALPAMHMGGPVTKSGGYKLAAGEHVLTQQQAKLARQHALMAIGMGSLAKPAQKSAQKPTGGEPKTPKADDKKSTSGITVRPEKAKANKIAPKKSKGDSK